MSNLNPSTLSRPNYCTYHDHSYIGLSCPQCSLTISQSYMDEISKLSRCAIAYRELFNEPNIGEYTLDSIISRALNMDESIDFLSPFTQDSVEYGMMKSRLLRQIKQCIAEYIDEYVRK